MKVQILGDSFGLPRLHSKTNTIEVEFENTYPELLRKKLRCSYPNEDIIILNSSKRFNNSLFLVRNEIIETILIQPEYIVIQVGIVDCWSRRPDTFIIEEFKDKNPWISKDEYFNNIDVVISNFLKNILGLKKIIIVNITKASSEQYKKHFNSYGNTWEFNNKLKLLKEKYNKVILVDAYREFSKNIESALCSDGVHPSSYGNNLIANLIFEAILNSFRSEK